MTGLAKKLFTELQKTSPWKPSPKKAQEASWTTLQALVDARYFSFIDQSLAEMVLKNQETEEDAALFICYLSLAVRSGHLCVRIENNEIHPPLETLFRQKDEERQEEAQKKMTPLLETLPMRIYRGAHNIPSGLMAADVESSSITQPLYRSQNHIYFQKYWLQESSFISHLKTLVDTQTTFQPNLEIIEKLLQTHPLLPEQAQAIRQAAAQNLTIICGGPGTGKTYTAGLLIKLLFQSLSSEQQKHYQIALAAPTGKAAANLQKSLARALTNSSIPLDCTAKTIHSLLGIGKTGKARPGQAIKAGLILIDECSMIDAHLMSKLFAAITPGTKLILLGDPHQLPPVESGLIFNDLVQKGRRNDSTMTIELVKCLRAELQPIVDLANAVKQGNSDAFLEILNTSTEGIDRLHPDNNLTSYALQSHFLELAIAKIPRVDPSAQSLNEMLHSFNRFKILAPLRQGPLGFAALNGLIAEQMQRSHQKNTPFIAPILITKNDYRLQLFNGETGMLIKKDAQSTKVKEGDVAVFPEGEGVKTIPALLLPQYDYAYCMSIHKSQGSEFDEVLVLLPEGSESFGREILYTAITRAKKRLSLWGSDATFRKVIETQTTRISGISHK